MTARFRCYCACISALWLAGTGANADLTQFTLESPSGGRLISLESQVRDGVGYVPLQALIEQAGGAYNVLPTRIRVDLDNSTAWLRVGESRVHALSIFSLGQLIADDKGNALIAAQDVPDFFLKSFRITVKLSAAAPSAPASMPPAGASTSLTPPGAPPTPAASLPKIDEAAALEQLGSAAAPRPAVNTILIDAGHGGYDLGVQSADKLNEAAIVLSVAKRVKALLETGGRLNVILTRPDESPRTLPQRAKIVRGAPGSIFISLHIGSSFSPTAEGIAAYYPAQVSASAKISAPAAAAHGDARLATESRRLAEALAPAIAQSASVPTRGILETPLKLLSEVQVPSVEVELGCLTSTADAQRLASDEYLGKLATGIFNGIQLYLNADATPPAPVAASPAPKAN